MKIKSLLVSMVLLILFMFSGCISDPSTLMKDNGLSSITGAEQLQKMFNDRTKLNRWSLFKGDVIVPESGTDELDEPNYTKTNVQVDGVDEGDVVKTDGERIYSIYQDMLRVVAIKESGAMELLLNECLSPKEENKDSWYYNNTYYYELYITDDYLVAIGQRYEIFSYDYDFGPNKRAPFSNTNMGVIAIYDLESLAKVKEYEVSGSIIASRLIEDDLYLITNYYPWLEANDLRPFTKNGEEIDYFAYQDIKYLTDVDCESYTIVTHLQLDTELAIENDVFLGASSWGYVYVSQSAIYLATMKYTYTFFWNGKYIGQIISYLFDEDGSVMYGGFGNFDGTIINQFAMDEYNDYLRIVTTEGWGKTAKNRLYVYERKIKNNRYVLEVVGKIFEGLGKP
ncbi:MAG: hypothetical protein GX661_00545, partial [Acholeplasmataceae bacterium]|nr:hypothetical protein [Acholeplasmataceae bacterium]